jgi:hypothetical protein
VSFIQVDKLFNPFTLLVGPCLVVVLMSKSTKPIDQGGYHLPWWYVSENLSSYCGIDVKFGRNILVSYLVWLSATRTAKLLPHLWNRPQDIIYVPAFILFGYYFAIMKLYALLTLHEVSVLVFVGYLRNHSHPFHRPVGVPVLVSATRLKPWLLPPLTRS